MQRRDFIKIASPIFLLLANGEIVRANEQWVNEIAKPKVKLRFVVASDGHYGQPDTDYENYFSALVNRINEEHSKNPFAFGVINGDIIHDDKKHFQGAKAALDKLSMKYYVSQGNHDLVNAAEWESIWKMPVNLDFKIKKNSFLVGTTSNEKGTYLCPDLKWFEQKLEEHKKQENLFIFIHINPGKLSKFAVDCPPFFELLGKHKNVRAVFNGHDHDAQGIKTKNGVSYMFDAHFGGSWGTDYRGFRVVELLKDNTIVTYIMNPTVKINEEIIANKSLSAVS